MKYLKIKYLFLFVVCLWLPLQAFIFKFDGAQRTLGVLILLTLLINITTPNFMRGLVKVPIIYWAIWIVYGFFNTVQLGYTWNMQYYAFIIILITPLAVLWLINEENFKDREILFNVIIAGLFIRILLIVTFDSIRSYDLGRFGNKIDSNDTAISAFVLIFFLYMKYLYNDFGIKIFLLLLPLPIYIIVIAASRNAFGALLSLGLIHFIIHRTKDNFSNLARLVVGLALIYVAFSYLINNTYLGQRLTETTQQNIEAEYDYDLRGSVFENFGDRGIFYVQGWELFKNHPIRGIGLGNFSLYNSNNVVLHSEYMIQLCELGIIGSLLFLFFYGWIGKNLFYCWKNDIENRKINEAYFFGFFVILFMALSVFQYTNPIFFLLSGIIIAHIMKTKEVLPQ